jgi:hypothetical protein
LIENEPSFAATTPFLVPFSIMDALGTGSPVASIIFPVAQLFVP